MTRRLVVTLDAEAQPARTDRPALDHLIHGEAGAGGFGLWRVLDVADRHGAVVTVFLDYAERDLWGEGVLDVGREVRRRGHDLQLHLHPEFLSPSRFEKAGLEPMGAVASATPAQLSVAVEALLDAHDRVGGADALAFRGGGYHVSDALLAALRAEGVTLDASYVPSRHAHVARGGGRRPFRWTNGVTETPVGEVAGFRNLDYPKTYNFNSTFLLREGERGRGADDAAARHAEFAELFWVAEGEDAPLVMVMHSWSLLRRGQDGRFKDGSVLAEEVLDRVLSEAAHRAEIVSMAALAAETDGAELPLATLEGTT